MTNFREQAPFRGTNGDAALAATGDAGLLLVGHGTRSEIGRAQFLSLAHRVGQRVTPTAVEAAFLELAEPTIDEAVGKLLERGARRLVIGPMLLFAAGHAKEDVPRAVRAALDRRRMEAAQVQQTAHFGCHPALLALAQLRLREAIERAGGEVTPATAAATCHLLVGRGSRDATATDQMHEFARLTAEATGLATEVAFLAMARPSLGEQLKRLSQSSYERIVVQPHLLFQGDLLESLYRQVAEARGLQAGRQWVVTAILADPPGAAGPGTELLETVLVERFQELESAKTENRARGE